MILEMRFGIISITVMLVRIKNLSFSLIDNIYSLVIVTEDIEIVMEKPYLSRGELVRYAWLLYKFGRYKISH